MEKLLKMLREVNVDTHAVGWYQSVNQGSLLTVSVIESQLSYQKDMKKCVVLAYDPSRTRQSSLYLKAYRLTPAFIELFSKQSFSKEKFDASAMRSTEIFEEIPVQITNSYLLTGFLSQIQNTKEMAPSFETLGVSSSHYLERTVDLLLQGAENLGQEQGKFQYYHKQVARQNQKKVSVFSFLFLFFFVLAVPFAVWRGVTMTTNPAR
jgi:translation initiation factor 3 subunit H